MMKNELNTLPFSTTAPKKSQFIWENYRFTVLTSRMIRLEHNSEGSFEDRATQTVLNRNFLEVPEFEVKETEGSLEITTSAVHLTFYKETGGFTKHNLHIEAIGNYSLYHSTWYFGETPNTLKGTARTLDEADGEVPLSEGLMNANGYSIIDDSHSMILTEDEWIEERKANITDMYFLGYGRDYLGTLKDYYHLTGKTPLLPRYSLGNWWSRYYPYSEEEYKKLMNRFEAEGYPFSVAVIDMDWHVTDVPKEYGSGWTGYTWNKDLFPEPEKFLDWLHKKNLHTTLNLHPANGVQPHEEMYEAMGQELGVDVTKKEPIRFDIADRKFLKAYFEYLHHPHEEIGVDFWWIDWQQGGISKIAGLDPLWILNHYHYLDNGRDKERALIFSRYAGLGSHRYPVGFSGDTIVSWESLAFQPYFTSTASNVGYTWWSHDIGGHMRGIKDDELFVRWVQYGVFSPINRLHSSMSLFSGKEPWRYGKQAEPIVKEFLQLRHRLVPYLYTMNVLTHEDSLPLVQPMYYHNQWDEEAYNVPNQYYFGTQLIAAPITEKMDDTLNMGHAKVWLPQGTWFDFFTSRAYSGGRMMDTYRSLEEIPVFAQAGAIIPLDQEVKNATGNPEKLEIRIYGGANGSFTMYEDDDTNSDYTTTRMELYWMPENGKTTFRIQSPKGSLDCLPEKRAFKLTFVGFDVKEFPEVHINGERVEVTIEEEGDALTMELLPQQSDSDYFIIFSDVKLKGNDTEKEIFAFLDRIETTIELKEAIYQLIKKAPHPAYIMSSLQAMDLDRHLLGALGEILWAHPQ